MIRTVVRFWLEPFVQYKMRTDPGWRSWANETTQALRPLVDDAWEGNNFGIDLDSPKLPELARLLERLRKEKRARSYMAFVNQSVLDDDKTKVEWFMLNREVKDYEASHLAPYWIPAIKADQMRPGSHVATGMCDFVVSERF